MDMPTTIEEWASYIGTLTGDTLYSKAMAANSIPFVRRLEEEGFAPSETESILTMFASQFQHDGQTVPSGVDGAYIDFNMLLEPMPSPT